MRLLITGGLGDFIAVESYLNEAEKNSITEILLATSASGFIQKVNEYYRKPYNMTVVIAPEQVAALPKKCYFSLEEIQRTSRVLRGQTDIVDGSIGKFFPDILAGRRRYCQTGLNLEKYVGSNYPGSDFVDSSNNFVVIDPASQGHFRETNPAPTQDELKLICDGAKQRDLPVREIGIGKTTIEEALSLVINCSHFFGDDSAFSVVASIASREIRQKKRMVVKSRNPHLFRSMYCYYPGGMMAVRHLDEKGVLFP